MEQKRYIKGEVALERALSKLGLASRSQAQKLIKSGKVRVEGKIITNPFFSVRPETAKIAIDEDIQTASEKVVFLFHKPKSTVTTSSDPEGRKTVFDFFSSIKEKLHAVGRLDYATSGVLILTNETQLSAYLSDPNSGIIRTYLVTVRGEVTPETAKLWTEGIEDKNEKLFAKKVLIQKSSKRETHLLIELDEGKNREIRRLCKSAGHEVTRLRRVAFGGLQLGDLAPGSFRKLTLEELTKAFPNIPEKIIKNFKN